MYMKVSKEKSPEPRLNRSRANKKRRGDDLPRRSQLRSEDHAPAAEAASILADSDLHDLP